MNEIVKEPRAAILEGQPEMLSGHVLQGPQTREHSFVAPKEKEHCHRTGCCDAHDNSSYAEELHVAIVI